MRAYSLDLRKKIVQSVRSKGVSISETARRFGVNRSTVGRYLKRLDEEGSLAPKKALGAHPKLDESAMRLLEEDIKARPWATHRQRKEFLYAACGVEVSETTICRAIKQRLSHSRKKDCEYCDHGVRDVLPVRSDPKKRGLRAFPLIRRPIGRASRRHRSESHVTS